MAAARRIRRHGHRRGADRRGAGDLAAGQTAAWDGSQPLGRGAGSAAHRGRSRRCDAFDLRRGRVPDGGDDARPGGFGARRSDRAGGQASRHDHVRCAQPSTRLRPRRCVLHFHRSRWDARAVADPDGDRRPGDRRRHDLGSLHARRDPWPFRGQLRARAERPAAGDFAATDPGAPPRPTDQAAADFAASLDRGED